VTTPAQGPDDEFGWLTNEFVRQIPGVAHAVVVSADGLVLTASNGLPRERAEQLSAVSAGLTSLTRGAARCFDAGGMTQTVVEMDGGYLFLMSISNGSCLAVLAAQNCDMGLVVYEMTLLVDRVGEQMTPGLRA